MYSQFDPFFNPQSANAMPFQALMQLLQQGLTANNSNPFGLSPTGFPIVTTAPMNNNPFGLTNPNPNGNPFDPLQGAIVNYAPTNQNNNGQNPYAGLSNPVDDIMNMLNPKQQFFQQFGIDYNPFNTAQDRPGAQMRQMFGLKSNFVPNYSGQAGITKGGQNLPNIQLGNNPNNMATTQPVKYPPIPNEPYKARF